MLTSIFKFIFYGMLLTWATVGEAQKNIIISDSLAPGKLPVKMGTQRMGRIWNFRFGEYAVISSKLGWKTTSTKSNLFDTKTESKSTEKFSFILSNTAKDSALVNAANNIRIKSTQELELFANFYLGNNELLDETRNFTAFISVNSDTIETWTLFMSESEGSVTNNNYQAFLTNGHRKILLNPTSSNKHGTDTRAIPALGYEGVENGRSLCALQYYGGGALGMNKNIVWLDQNQDAKMKLILAAAMTAVLQVKVSNFN